MRAGDLGEIEVDVSRVRRMVAEQFPQWASLPIEPVASAGTDNTLFRLGQDKCVRLPRVPRAAGQVAKEQRWLPRLAPLPLAIPRPLGHGLPAHGYPWSWSVYGWLEGQNVTIERIAEPDDAAAALADFVAALQRIDPSGGPLCGPHNEHRGVPLALRDVPTRAAIASLAGLYDADALTAAWDAALDVPPWPGPPVWLHGDIHAGNLLARDGRLTAVIDFGLLGVGDPACDLMVAWTLLESGPRAVFRATLDVDEATWLRGRGWALSFALAALAYYREGNPVLSPMARRAIEAVLVDWRQSG